jgi:hypothetical protein
VLRNVLIGATALAGALLPWLLPREAGLDPVVLVVLAALAVVAGMRCVKPTGHNTWFVPTDAFVLAGVVTLGGRAACALALAGLAGTALGLSGRLPVSRIFFNAGAVLVATVAAATLYRSMGLAAAAACFFLVNTFLVAAVVALDRSASWLGTWRRTFLPAVPRFGVAALLAAALCGLAAWGPAWMLGVGLLPSLSLKAAETVTSPR